MHLKLFMPVFPGADKRDSAAIRKMRFPADWIVEVIDDLRGRHLADDMPDLVLVLIDDVNARRGFVIADHYRASGSYIAVGGPHITTRPDVASSHADTILIGPCEQLLPCFLRDWQAGHPSKRYIAGWRNAA